MAEEIVYLNHPPGISVIKLRIGLEVRRFLTYPIISDVVWKEKVKHELY